MISLNDYLYSGDTVLKILHQYEHDLRMVAEAEHNPVDLAHCAFLAQNIGLLERNDFLSYQSHRIREYYKFMTREFPELAFTFHGRIKSLMRAESKFNGYIIEIISNYYNEFGRMPSDEEVAGKLNIFRDLIAYRIVISYPTCHLQAGEDVEEKELAYLYKIAGQLPQFMQEQGFRPEKVEVEEDDCSPLEASVRGFYKDYVTHPTPSGYRSLHITFYDDIAGCYTEMQIRTKKMDDYAVIGPANHLGYEKRQIEERSYKDSIPRGLSRVFDEACERQRLLQTLDITTIHVNMFTAYSPELVNDGCGLLRGRLITPFEHLSRFQNDDIGMA